MLSWRMMQFWYSASVAAHAMLKRMSQNDEATIVFHVCFSAGCCDMRNLSASLALVLFFCSAVDFFEEGHHRGAHSSTG